MATTSTSIQIVDGYSPIDVLTARVLKRYGESSPSTLDADTFLTFMDYANSVLDDVMEHPYWKKGVVIPYYNHQTERRDVPDSLMQAGLLARFSVDQMSQKSPRYEADYFKRLNQVLTRTKFGVGAEFSMQTLDYPTTVGSTGIPGVF
jgi:hypothetical protein